MSRSTGSRRATTALALAIWSQACVVHRPAPASEFIRPGANVRIRSVAPLELTRQKDTLPAVTVCCTNSVEGRFVRVAGDTIVLGRGGDAVNSNLDRIRGQHETLAVVRTPETEVTLRQTDRARTTLLLLGITGAVIGLAALAASQIEYGFPPSGTFFVSP